MLSASAVSIWMLKSTLIEFEQRVVPFGRGTADAVADEDHAVSMIDSAHDRPLHADIGLGTRNDEAVCLPGTKMVQQEGFEKAEYLVLSITVAGGASLPRQGMSSSSRGSSCSRVVSPPLFVIAAPCSRHVARTLRRYEPRKDGTLWKSMAYRQDHRQHPLHPGRSPGPVGRENALHMMHRCTVRGVNGRGRRSSVMSSPFVSSGNVRQPSAASVPG